MTLRAAIRRATTICVLIHDPDGYARHVRCSRPAALDAMGGSESRLGDLSDGGGTGTDDDYHLWETDDGRTVATLDLDCRTLTLG